MFQIILCLLAGLGPSLALYFWLSRRLRKEPAYQQSCKKALTTGLSCVFPVVLTSGALYLLLHVTKLQDKNALLYEALYNFIVLALAEELNKYLAFRRFLKKSESPCSWLDLTVFMTIVGMSFGLAESLVYLLGSSPIDMLLRGIVIPHAGYGAIVGWFYGKSLKTGKRGYITLGFVISWLLHGLYDFSLSNEFSALGDAAMVLAFTLTALNLLLVIGLIVFAVKARKKETYTTPLLNAETEAVEAEGDDRPDGDKE